MIWSRLIFEHSWTFIVIDNGDSYELDKFLYICDFQVLEKSSIQSIWYNLLLEKNDKMR